MKKIQNLIIVMLLLISNNILAQQPVVDAQANTIADKTNVNVATTLTKTTAMLEQISHMRQKYDKMMENVEKVNSMISSGQQIKKITNSIVDIKNNYQNSINYIKSEDMIAPEEKVKFISALTKMVSKAVDDLDDALIISTTGTYNMTDAERLQFLNSIYDKIAHQNNLIKYFLNKIKRGVSQQQVKKANKEFIDKSAESLKQ